MDAKSIQIASLLTLLFALSCGSDPPVSSDEPGSPRAVHRLDVPGTAPGAEPPGGLVQVSYGGGSLELWPYASPDGDLAVDPLDPINLIFVGNASALQIRAALLALDGNRTAYGFPPVYPFNATWSDGMGGVQAAYSEGAGWIGSVIQLSLGAYGPVRFHLRLFETGEPFGTGGVWTLGGAHFELLIPGTPEHQVICWEIAEQIVTADLARSGLLQAAPGQTQVINDAPGFRTIPVSIFNVLPAALKVCGLPPGPTAVPVPIPTDGRATVLNLGGTTPIVDDAGSESLAIQFNQVIEKPFCAAGPAGFFRVEGPVDLTKSVRVDAAGRYTYHYELSGHLTATPLGGGEPFDVQILDTQSGFLNGDEALLTAQVKRIAPQDGGSELLLQFLSVRTNGLDRFQREERCLTP